MKTLDHLLQRQAQGEHIQHRLKYGIPEIGWDGDPWLSLYHNKLLDTWEVWDERFDEPVLLAQRPAATIGRVEDAVVQLCAHLRDHDFRKVTAKQVLDRVEKHNESVRRELQRQSEDRIADAADRLRHGLIKDIGHLY